MLEFPLQLFDDFIRNYHVGHVLFLAFVFAAIGGFAVNRSVKLLGINFALFGLLFILTPNSTMPVEFLYFGVMLVVVGPVIAIAGDG
jgi:hypothetical protein